MRWKVLWCIIGMAGGGPERPEKAFWFEFLSGPAGVSPGPDLCGLSSQPIARAVDQSIVTQRRVKGGSRWRLT
jgi:hypothetical protein